MAAGVSSPDMMGSGALFPLQVLFISAPLAWTETYVNNPVYAMRITFNRRTSLKIHSFEMTPFCMNCFVLEEDGEAIIVDPGEASQELIDCIEGLKVVMVLNTHCHIDHVGGNGAMVSLTKAPLVCHKDDLPMLEGLEVQAQMFNVPAPSSPKPDRLIAEGEVIQLGASTLKVLHTPGHSPGHIVLVGDGFVIGGDVLFAGSIGRTDLPGGNHEELLASIKDKLLPLPDDTRVYCGHGPSTTIGAERRSNPFLVNL